MKRQVEYVVLYFDPQGSPAVLAKWLTGICRSEGLKFVSADNGYYIFERASVGPQKYPSRDVVIGVDHAGSVKTRAVENRLLGEIISVLTESLDVMNHIQRAEENDSDVGQVYKPQFNMKWVDNVAQRLQTALFGFQPNIGKDEEESE